MDSFARKSWSPAISSNQVVGTQERRSDRDQALRRIASELSIFLFALRFAAVPRSRCLLGINDPL